ncbi:MAG: hypothetical protein FK731_08980 [Asgard group archaeon]|nr:hypothetical protein [Asgard group archaeon]
MEITFEAGITNMQIDELLFFKDMEIPDYLKLLYQQTNGFLIENDYFLDDLNDPSHFRVISCDNLFYTSKRLNLLPDKRFIRFAENEEDALYLLDTENLNPEGLPLILLNMPSYKFSIPLTNNFEVLLEAACLGILGLIEFFGLEEGKKLPKVPQKMLSKKKKILPILKEFFLTAKREYDLIDIWHLSPKAKKQIQLSIAYWFKGLKNLLSIFH